MMKKYYCKVIFKKLKSKDRSMEDSYYTNSLEDGKEWIREIGYIYDIELYYIIEVETDELVYSSEEDEIGF